MRPLKIGTIMVKAGNSVSKQQGLPLRKAAASCLAVVQGDVKLDG
jgi:hypothetical protein